LTPVGEIGREALRLEVSQIVLNLGSQGGFPGQRRLLAGGKAEALLADMILQIRREGVTVLLAEQNLHFCAKVADRGYVIDKGSVKYEGSMSDLLSNEEIKEKYLAV